MKADRLRASIPPFRAGLAAPPANRRLARASHQGTSPPERRGSGLRLSNLTGVIAGNSGRSRRWRCWLRADLPSPRDPAPPAEPRRVGCRAAAPDDRLALSFCSPRATMHDRDAVLGSHAQRVDMQQVSATGALDSAAGGTGTTVECHRLFVTTRRALPLATASRAMAGVSVTPEVTTPAPVTRRKHASRPDGGARPPAMRALRARPHPHDSVVGHRTGQHAVGGLRRSPGGHTPGRPRATTARARVA